MGPQAQCVKNEIFDLVEEKVGRALNDNSLVYLTSKLDIYFSKFELK